MSETYYGRFYGFDSPPFHITPDPSLLFATETHQQALGTIEYGIASGKGFIVVTGEVGVGKTTVLKMCLDKQFDSSKIKIIYLFNPALTVPELYATILEELDVSHGRSMSPAGILRRLLRALLAMHKAGLQVILAVDEAQNMPERTLEGLRILSNLETAKSKLLQIILVGQPELDAMLAKHSLRQLAQRVAVRARIKPLTWRQSCRYIQYRSQCAGRERPLFTAPALWYLAATAHGIPRAINICCDNALINGYGHAAERISLSIARESCHALQLRASFRRFVVTTTAAMVLVSIAFSGDALLRRFLATPAPDKVLKSASPNRAALAAVAGVATASPQSLTASVSPIAEALVEASPALPPDAGRAVAAPVSARVHAIAPAQTATDSVAAEPSSRPEPQPVWRWFVRKGDTVYKACRTAYGQCDQHALHTVFAYNPQIASNATIRQGMVIIMPERIEPTRTN
jgi:type II secretory pathway predicted ATPase ExeA